MPAAARLIKDLGATLVNEVRARAIGLLGPDESYAPSVPDIDEVRRQLVLTLKAIGKLQTGRDVSLGWCHNAATVIAEAATGECDFDLHENDHVKTVKLILQAAEKELKAAMKEGVPADPDIPF